MVGAVKNTWAQQEHDLSQFGASLKSYQKPCSQYQSVVNQLSLKFGNSLHKRANGSSPDPFSTNTKKNGKAVWPHDTNRKHLYQVLGRHKVARVSNSKTFK